MFRRDAVEKKYITREHIPPKKLGGSVKTLTCKNCNNGAGSILDKELLTSLGYERFFTGETDEVVDVKYYMNDNSDLFLNAEFSFSDNGNWQLFGVPDRSNPKDLITINQLISDQGINEITIEFSMHKSHHPHVALLRIAYLWAFSVLGYFYISQPALSKIREQIRNPNKRILDGWGQLLAKDIPDEFLGLNIISSPINLRAFLVVFDIKKYKKRYAILLPGFSPDSLSVYSAQGEAMRAIIHNIGDGAYFRRNPLIALEIWNTFTTSDI
jgi:hypothetical protein